MNEFNRTTKKVVSKRPRKNSSGHYSIDVTLDLDGVKHPIEIMLTKYGNGSSWTVHVESEFIHGGLLQVMGNGHYRTEDKAIEDANQLTSEVWLKHTISGRWLPKSLLVKSDSIPANI